MTHVMLKKSGEGVKQSESHSRPTQGALIAARKGLTEIRNPSVFSGIWTGSGPLDISIDPL
jgi:hypothetical protein